MGLKLTQEPAVEPVSVDEAKLHCTESGTGFDSAFTNIWIPAARREAEHRTGRALITQVWQLTLERFPCRAIKLPHPPLQQVNFIKYLDLDGVQQTLATSEYQVVNDEVLGFVVPAYGKNWPSARCQPGSIQIEYKAGFGDAAAEVPQNIRHWMLMAIGTWYRQREGIVTGTIVSELPRNFMEALLDQHTIPRI